MDRGSNWRCIIAPSVEKRKCRNPNRDLKELECDRNCMCCAKWNFSFLYKYIMDFIVSGGPALTYEKIFLRKRRKLCKTQQKTMKPHSKKKNSQILRIYFTLNGYLQCHDSISLIFIWINYIWFVRFRFSSLVFSTQTHTTHFYTIYGIEMIMIRINIEIPDMAGRFGVSILITDCPTYTVEFCVLNAKFMEIRLRLK